MKISRDYKLGKEVVKISLYADDIVCFLQNPKQSLQKVCKLLGCFGMVSGYKINYGKSEFLGYNIPVELKQNICETLPARWSEEVRYLGIIICNNHGQMVEKI